MEPERPIEQALREYAEKRRKQAGDPIDLHQATRRLLQGEVARQFRRQAPGRPSMFVWLTASWQHLVGTLAVVALVGALTTIVLSSLTRTRTETRLARLEKEQPAGAVSGSIPQADETAQRRVGPLRDLTNLFGEPASPPAQVALNDPARAADAAKVEPSRELDDTAAAGAESKAKSADLALASEARSRLTTSGLRPPAPGPSTPAKAGGTATPSAAPPAEVATATAARSSGGTGGARPIDELSLGVRFDRISEETPALAFANKSSTSPVLNSFQVEQKGGDLRVVDADGSVYSGSVEQLDQNGRKEPGRDAEPATDRGQNLAPSQPRQDRYQSGGTNHWNYSFRVVGTNRTANALVLFTGRIAAETNLGALVASTNFGTPAALQRISGKAVIGGREIGIEAVKAR